MDIRRVPSTYTAQRTIEIQRLQALLCIFETEFKLLSRLQIRYLYFLAGTFDCGILSPEPSHVVAICFSQLLEFEILPVQGRNYQGLEIHHVLG